MTKPTDARLAAQLIETFDCGGYTDEERGLVRLAAERLKARNEISEALERADCVIERMMPYAGKMALNADDLRALNEHFLFMERRRCAADKGVASQ